MMKQPKKELDFIGDFGFSNPIKRGFAREIGVESFRDVVVGTFTKKGVVFSQPPKGSVSQNFKIRDKRTKDVEFSDGENIKQNFN